MNFISWNKAYSLYPVPTFHGGFGVLMCAYSQINEEEIIRLKDMLGIETFRLAGYGSRLEATLRKHSRHVGDSTCWVYQLPGSKFDTVLPFRHREIEWDYHTGNSWTVAQPFEQGNMEPRYHLQCYQFENIALIDTYTISALVQSLVVPIIDNDVLKIYRRLGDLDRSTYHRHFTYKRQERAEPRLPFQQ
jgi:hypothetical protein